MTTISEGQYDYLKRQIKELKNELSEVLFQLQQIHASNRKHLLDFEECIPPKSVCLDAMSMLGVVNYKGMMRLLADYYGIVRLPFFVDPEQVPKGAIACYYREKGTAYSKNKEINPQTVLHEFFHHLTTNKVVMLYESDDEEVLANKYAKFFLERAGEQP